MGEYIFTFAVLGVATGLALVIRWDIARLSPSSSRGRRFLNFAAVCTYCNVLLIWLLFATDYLFPGIHSPADATLAEYHAKVATLWGSLTGISLSLTTLVSVGFSEDCLARILCAFGSVAAVFLWGMTNLVCSESVAIYESLHPK